MNTFKRHLGLMLGSILVVTGIWACKATSNADGSVTIEFAPDMVITARGLEDALSKLNELLADCITGTFGRPCTDGERADIGKAIAKVLRRKDRMDAPIPTFEV